MDEQKRLMVEARPTQRDAGGASRIKSYLSGLETQTLKKRKGVGTKATSSMAESQISVPTIQEEVQQGTPKRIKTLMIDEVFRAHMEITSLMGEHMDSHAYEEFKFWSNSFDGIRFLYDHLNTTDDFNKIKFVGQ